MVNRLVWLLTDPDEIDAIDGSWFAMHPERSYRARPAFHQEHGPNTGPHTAVVFIHRQENGNMVRCWSWLEEPDKWKFTQRGVAFWIEHYTAGDTRIVPALDPSICH